MQNSLAGKIPLGSGASKTKTDDKATSAETTPGGHEPTDWEVVADNLLPVEAAIIKGRLESVEIPAFVQQESIGSVMGLTVGPLGSAKVLVPGTLLERALAILNDTVEIDDE